jgi:signal transduction histidine kinase
MSIGRRLLLMLLPSFVGLALVVALAYWGEYAREAPHLAVLTAGAAVFASALLAWRNARYVGQRVARLASTPEGSGATHVDELESIEMTVDRLRTEAEHARREEARRIQELESARRDATELLAGAASEATRALEEVRLPLHILLENRFGDLNENQEEMLGSAQSSADEASALFHRLRLVSDLERGVVEPRRDAVRVDEAIRRILPMLESEGERREVRVSADLEPGLPRIAGDRTYLHEALTLILMSVVRRTPAGGAAHIVASRGEGGVSLVLQHGNAGPPTLDDLLARRLCRSLGIGLESSSERTTITLTAATSSSVV